MTDLDGKNILSLSSSELAVLFDFKYGYFDRLAHNFFMLDGGGGAENEMGMICRSNCTVKNVFVEVVQNAFLGATAFQLRKNGDNVNALNPLYDVRVFNLTAGQLGLFEATGETFDFEKDDLICWNFFEAEPNQSIRYRVGMTMEFDPL